MVKRFLLSVYLCCAGPALPVILYPASIVVGQVPEIQNSVKYRLIRLLYSNTGGEEAMTDFEYDAFGNLAFSRWKVLNDERHSVNRYILNRNGQMIEKNRIFSDSVTSGQEYFYDPCGNLLRETYSRSDGMTGAVQYLYDEQGKLIESICRNKGGWFTGKVVYSYNSYDMMDQARILKKDEPVGKIEYQYDINGNLKREKWTFDDEWEQVYIYEYFKLPDTIYSLPNPFVINRGFYRIEKEHYAYTNGSSGPSIYDYDEGKLVKKIFTRSDGLSTETIYNYDVQGLLISASRQFSEGKTADIHFSHDDHGRLTRKWSERSDGLKGEETYLYDSQGKLAMAEYRQVDAWLSGTIAFSHDSYGLPIKGYFRGENNFDAEIYFYYDEYKNLVKVQWDFSFGKSQVYTYTYRALYYTSQSQSPKLIP